MQSESQVHIGLTVDTLSVLLQGQLSGAISTDRRNKWWTLASMANSLENKARFSDTETGMYLEYVDEFTKELLFFFRFRDGDFSLEFEAEREGVNKDGYLLKVYKVRQLKRNVRRSC
ncbi:MAG: hypothetical protein GY818_05545 [Planctomycetaceae bacterium]|nr:hypothetical protein [Planctomycetaceae bacterium]